MIWYVVTDTAEKYATKVGGRQKMVLEDCAGDACLVLHYRQVSLPLLRKLDPWAVCHSGSGTPFEDYDILKCRPYRDLVLRGRVPQLGICGGHQLMALFHGAKVETMRRLRAGDPDVNPQYHPGDFKEWGVYPVETIQPDPLFRGLGSVLRVQQFHRSEVRDLPRDLVNLARSPDCEVQALRHCRKPLYGVQFHPEEASAAYPDGFRLLGNFFDLARKWRRANGAQAPAPDAVWRNGLTSAAKPKG